MDQIVRTRSPSAPPAYRGKEPYVFVCYSHADARTVFAEIEWLSAHGQHVWYDEGISPGHQWQDELARYIDGCAQFLFYVSPAAISSPHCVNEVYYALDAAKPMRVVYLEETRVVGGMRLAIGSIQAIFRSHHAQAEYRRQLLDALESERAEPARPPPRPAVTRGASDDETQSLAVLPFVGAASDPDIEYLGDGIADELVTDLSRLPNLRVVASSSSFRLRAVEAAQAGRRLGVASVLTGRIRRSRDRLRLSAQLVASHDGTSLWSGRYDAALVDLLDLQENLARQILMALRVYLDTEQHDLLSPGTISTPAYNAYLLGKHERSRLTRDALDRSVAGFRQAIAHDPQFVMAYDALWEALDYRARRFGGRDETFDEQRGIVRRLRELDPQRVQVNWTYLDRYMASRGFADLDMDESEQLFHQMFLEGRHVTSQRDGRECWFRYGMLLAKAGWFEAARAYLERAEALHPMDEYIKFRLGEVYLALGDRERGLGRLNQAMAISPQYLEPLIDILVFHCMEGDHAGATRAAERIAPVFDADLNRLVSALLAFARRRLPEAIATLRTLETSDSVPAVYKGFAWLLCGDVQRSTVWIGKAWRQGDEIATEIRLVGRRMATPGTWARALASPPFVKLLDAIGLGDRWCLELGRRACALTPTTGIEIGDQPAP